MRWRSMVRLALPACVAIGLLAAGVSARGTMESGRYKKQGDKCVWDSSDSGPNQCTPVTPGRFKKDGSSCVWAGNETGPDQCRPAKGRFKKDGTACVWNATDTGPDQCDPHQAK